MSSHLRHELIEISMPVIQWMLAKAPTPSKKVCSRRKRHGDFEKVKQKWSSRHRAAHDVHRPVMIIWYTDLMTLFGSLQRVSVAYAEARHMKRDTQLQCWLHILNFPHVHTSISTRYRVYVVSEYFRSVRIFPRLLRQGRSTYVSSKKSKSTPN